MPVRVQVDGVRTLADSRDRSQTVTIDTQTKPVAIVLDPDHILIDLDPANNRKTL